MRIPSLRDAYDAVERQVAPRAEALTHTEQAALVSALALRLRRDVGLRVDALSAQILHLANLPAGTDIKRLRRQIGDLDREVRKLRLELSEAREEVRRDAQHRPESGGRPGPT
jgi:hypothetical protein